MIDEKKLAQWIRNHIISLVNDTDANDLPMAMGGIITLSDVLVNVVNGKFKVDPPLPVNHNNYTCQDCLYMISAGKYDYKCAYNRRERDTVICDEFKLGRQT